MHGQRDERPQETTHDDNANEKTKSDKGLNKRFHL